MTSTAQARQANAPAENTQCLTFMLGTEVFGIDILSIKEIIEYDGLTTVPTMPECVRGVINLRGAVVPVLDLALRFGKRPAEITKKTCIVIIERIAEGAREDLGVLVDAVNAVVDIAATDIEPAPSFGARIQSDFIQGLGKIGGRFVILLNVGRVLEIETIVAAANAQRAGETGISEMERT